MRVRAVEHKSAQRLRGIKARIIAETIKQADKDSLIDVEGGLSHSTVFSHPGTEFSHNRS